MDGNKTAAAAVMARIGRTQHRKQVPANRPVLVSCFSLLIDYRHYIAGLHLNKLPPFPSGTLTD
jgi:hypothetical protein